MGIRDQLKLLKTQYAPAVVTYSYTHPDVVKLKREIEGLESELGSQSDYRDTTRRLSRRARIWSPPDKPIPNRARMSFDCRDRYRVDAQITDSYYLTQKATEMGYHPEMILACRRLNHNMGLHVAKKSCP